MPIGAADMPVVIALLNSYAGLADAAMGFVLMNKIQIITGSLDGTSGFLAVAAHVPGHEPLGDQRALRRVRQGRDSRAGPAAERPRDRPQHRARGGRRPARRRPFGHCRAGLWHGGGPGAARRQRPGKLLAKRGIDVKYAIHPVAGRMPGHMNVLLAEANVPYDQLYEMEQINPYFAEADIALVVGANDVTNPAAKNNKISPLYGMPILEVDRARSIIVLKRSMRPASPAWTTSCITTPRCMMLFGDAKDSLNKLFACAQA